MRQADLLDDRPRGLEGRHRLADPALDVRLHPGDEVLARQPEPLAAEPCRRLVVARRESDQLVRHWHRRRGRVALVAPGNRVEQRGGRGVRGLRVAADQRVDHSLNAAALLQID